MNVHDLVVIKSDLYPIIYIIEEKTESFLLLRGYSHRILIHAKENEVELAPTILVEKEKKIKQKYIDRLKMNTLRGRKNFLYGTVLHLDGDNEFLDNCKELYHELGIHANCFYMDEKELPNYIEELTLQLTPDIIVITGHDFFKGEDKKKLENYENSQYFVDSVRKVRRHFNADEVTMIVGACASHYEAILASGANFASSPARIHIHTYDPAVIAIKAATTSCNRVMDFESILKYIENKRDAFGGIETKGKMKSFL